MKLIRFEAVWCPACLIMKQRLKKINLENVEQIVYNYDIDTEMINKYEIGQILPVMILEDENGHELTRMIGEKSISEIENTIKEQVG